MRETKSLQQKAMKAVLRLKRSKTESYKMEVRYRKQVNCDFSLDEPQQVPSDEGETKTGIVAAPFSMVIKAVNSRQIDSV